MRVLIVEDEFLIAMTLESMLLDLGHDVIGTAPDKSRALAAIETAEIAFVDVRLADGVTGPEIGAALNARGVTVVFTTGNPEAVLDSEAGVGVVTKPYDEASIDQALAFAIACREGRTVPPPPRLIRIPVVTQ